MSKPDAKTDPNLALLLSYADRGWAVLPLWGVRKAGATLEEAVCACPEGAFCGRSRGKHPNGRLVPDGVKGATRDKAIIKEWFKSYPNSNWGVRCGDPLPQGGYLVVLDEDPRNGGTETLEAIQGLRGELPHTVVQESGGNGRHFLLEADAAVHEKSLGPGVDLQSQSKYIVVEPSTHWSGQPYAWSIGRGPDDVNIAKAPSWILDQAATSTGARPPRLGEGTARDTILGEAFAIAGMLGVGYADGNVAVTCPWANEHSDARGKGTDSSTVILPPAGGSHFGGFRCMHGHCAGRKWQDVLGKLPPHAVAEAHRKYPPRLQVVSQMESPPVAEEIAPAAPKYVGDPLDVCRKKLSYKPTKGGAFKVEADLVNAVTILAYDHRWEGVLRLDEFSMCLRKTKQPPWHPDDAARDEAPNAIWNDQDNSRLLCWFKRYWAIDLAEEKCHRAAYQVAIRNGFHPLKDYLRSLKWDGVPRLDTWTTAYLGTKDTPYARRVGAWWAISAAARGINPGCKADHLVIFEGPQGAGKSTTLSALVPDPTWFSDTPIVIGNKDAYVALRGKWIIELAELESLGKAESGKAKAFFSSPKDDFRPPFGKESVSVPRSCVFAGSVNHSEYLRDETGNRRYWPLLTGSFNVEGLRKDRDQLWAEAVSRYDAGEQWWPAPGDSAMLDNEQKSREYSDAWLEDVAIWVHGDEGRKLLREHGYISAAQICKGALMMSAAEIGRNELTRVAQILLRALNWTKVPGRVGGASAWVFSPPAKT